MELKSQLRSRGICVIIPTYNNEKSIRQVVTDTLNYCDDVIVVNDGSTDRTTATLHKMGGITLVSYPQNKGKGGVPCVRVLEKLSPWDSHMP